jgi:soluble lytic murein transglycosylase-like protein
LYVERPYRDIEDVRERGLRLLEEEAGAGVKSTPKSEPKPEPKMEFKPIDPAVDSPPPAKVSEFRLNNAIEEEGAAHLTPVITAIFNQESSGGKDTRTSVDNARGPMQIIPSTFKMYAKEGERINDPADNMRVGVRYIKDIASKYGDDPARIATAYFSGEGNVNKGKGNAWKQDYADGNGKRTSAYARDVVNRIEKMKKE